MSVVTLKCDKGVNKDLLPAELDDGWVSDCKNYRFRDGFAEPFEGGTTYTLAAGYVPHWGTIFETTSRYVVTSEADPYGLGGKAYASLYSGLTALVNYDITRYTPGAEIQSITRVGTTATLTTQTAHGLSTGNKVSIYGCSPSEFNSTSPADDTITVTSPTTFTYTIVSDPGADASVIGAYSYNVEALFTSSAVTGGLLNGTLIYNNAEDGLYYWSGNTSVRLRRVPFSYVAAAARPFKNYIVQVAPTIDGTQYLQDVVWSNAAEPGAIPTTFTASDTNDAGRVSLAATPGPLVDCLPLGDVNIIYGRNGRYAMQYIGGNDVFSFTKLPGEDGVYNINCVVDTPIGHVFLTQNRDVMVHQGGVARSITTGRLTKWMRLAAGAYSDNTHFLMVNPHKHEVWVCLKGNGSTTVGSVAVWSWEYDTWGLFDLTGLGVTFGCGGYWGTDFYTAEASSLLIASDVTSGKVFNVKPLADGTINSAEISCYIERSGLTLGDRDTIKTLQRSRWQVDADAGASFTATVSHGAAQLADASPTYSTATYTHGTSNFVDKRATAGRFLSAKFAVNASSKAKIRSFDLDVTGGGKR